MASTEAKRPWWRNSKTHALWTSGRRGSRKYFIPSQDPSRGFPSPSLHPHISEEKSVAPTIAVLSMSLAVHRLRCRVRAVVITILTNSVRHIRVDVIAGATWTIIRYMVWLKECRRRPSKGPRKSNIAFSYFVAKVLAHFFTLFDPFTPQYFMA